ncbi:MAG: tetraacyldisaccharide 4'-kinase, partial [Flavobacteriales bacterium]
MADIKQWLPAAWQRQAWWLVLLLPLSGLYALVTSLLRLSYRLGVQQAYRAPVPVMVIGNITVGGSGKTPLIIHLVQYLRQQHQLNVGVISRGYGAKDHGAKDHGAKDQAGFPKLVDAWSTPDQVGDEPVLIVQQTGVPMAVAPNRQAAIECLLASHPEIELILSDDGLQHFAMARDIEWIVLDAARGLGSGW